jgi:hypothetical protein
VFVTTAGLVCAFVSHAIGQTNSWKGLVPLHSTRRDVESRFGKPNPERLKYLNEYKVGDDTFQVEYSGKPCDEGWDVPVGTVLRLRVADHDQINKSSEDLKLDEKRFSISTDDALYATWTEPIIGLQYYFMHGRMSLIYVTYIPRREDNDKRCDGFPPYTPEAHYFTMDTDLLHNPNRAKTDDKLSPAARLDNAYIQLVNNPGYRLYVLIYFDTQLSLTEYRKRVAFLKNWMYVRRKAKPDDVVFLEGGMREKNYMELHIIPKDWKAPAPEPTLASPQFRRPKSAIRATSPKT